MSHPDLSTMNPGLYKHMVQFDAQAAKACQEAGLSDLLIELIRLRVSQINGCAYCLRMHTRDALAKGETTDRLGVLTAWWESQYFTD